MKSCRKCGEVKAISLFTKNKNCKSGYENTCVECTKAAKKAHYLKNRDKYLQDGLDRYYKNKDKRAKQIKAWSKNNKDKVAKYKINYRKSKQGDSLFRLKQLIRKQTWRAVKVKQNNTLSYLGVKSWEFIEDYLALTFEKNYGLSRDKMDLCDLHIDHIIPLSSAKTEEELIKLAHYTNLQYLTAKDNLSKSNKLEEFTPTILID